MTIKNYNSSDIKVHHRMNVIVECHGNEKKEGFTKKEVGGKVRARQDKEVLLVLNRRWLTCKAFDSCKDEVSRRCKRAK